MGELATCCVYNALLKGILYVIPRCYLNELRDSAWIIKRLNGGA